MFFRRFFLSLLSISSFASLILATYAATIPDSDAQYAVGSPSNGHVQAAYFTNWGIYGANFQPSDINSAPLTHLLYAFADIQSDGTIVLTDPYADEQKHYPGDSWSEPGNNLYGCLKQMYLIKLKQRNIKVLLSIGGWTYSQNGHFDFVTDTNARSKFISTAVQLVKDYGFDGVDIDYEYPSNAAQGQGFADLLTSLRSAFDELAASKGDNVPYQITAAVAAGPSSYAYLPVAQMNAALTYWNLMAYDYAGSWLTYTADASNVYGGDQTGISTDKALSFYLTHGATAGKINIGLPLYGRAFEQTDGVLGHSYNGVGPGTREPGVYSYSALPFVGAQVIEDTHTIASRSYDSVKQELVSYDSPNIAKLKAQYVQFKGLAGAMFWELSTDKTNTPDSLVTTTANVFGSLDQTLNHIHYPDSKWDNIRNNMGTSASDPEPSDTSSSSDAAPLSTSVPVAQSTSSQSTPTTTDEGTTSLTSSSATSASSSTSTGGTLCTGIAAWDAQTAYPGGSTVTYGAQRWTSKWWTQDDAPGGPSGVWVDGGGC